MLKLYEISHFLAFLCPALTFYIFCLPDHLPKIIHLIARRVSLRQKLSHSLSLVLQGSQLGGGDTERLLEDENEIRFSSISSIYQQANPNMDVVKPFFK